MAGLAVLSRNERRRGSARSGDGPTVPQRPDTGRGVTLHERRRPPTAPRQGRIHTTSDAGVAPSRTVAPGPADRSGRDQASLAGHDPTASPTDATGLRDDRISGSNYVFPRVVTSSHASSITARSAREDTAGPARTAGGTGLPEASPMVTRDSGTRAGPPVAAQSDPTVLTFDSLGRTLI